MYMFYVSVVTGFALWWAIAWFGGILFAGVWPRLKSKIAKANCCMIAAIPMIFVGQMSVYCMCGHPLGLEHYVNAPGFMPYINLFLTILMPYFISLYILPFWIAVAFRMNPRREGEGKREFRLRRIRIFLKVLAVSFSGCLVTFGVLAGAGTSKYLLILALGGAILGMFAALLWRRKVLLIFLAFLSLGASAYFVFCDIPREVDKDSLKYGLGFGPMLEAYIYSENDDPKDKGARGIWAIRSFEFFRHVLEGDWKKAKPFKAEFYSNSESPEEFAKMKGRISSYVLLLDDSYRTRGLLDLLESGDAKLVLDSKLNALVPGKSVHIYCKGFVASPKKGEICSFGISFSLSPQGASALSGKEVK